MVKESDYDMKGYLDMTQQIARKKLDMYAQLLANIKDFKKKYAKYY